jgi:hypothetical protein
MVSLLCVHNRQHNTREPLSTSLDCAENKRLVYRKMLIRISEQIRAHNLIAMHETTNVRR